MDSLDAVVYVTDMDTYEILFIKFGVKNYFVLYSELLSRFKIISKVMIKEGSFLTGNVNLTIVTLKLSKSVS